MQNNLTVRAQKIAALEAKLTQLKEAERLAALRQKSARSRAERAADTRRKVLIGAFVLDQLGSTDSAARFAIGSRKFVDWLQRDLDRAALGIAPLARPAPEPASQQAQGAGGSA